MRALCLPLLLVLSACPDPTTSAATDAGATPGAPPDPGAGGGAPPPGDPGAAGIPAGRPEVAGWKPAAGESVKLSGTVSYNGTGSGTIRLDFLRPAATGGFPELLHSMSLDAPGAFSVEAPKDAGEIGIVAFIDSANDGPSQGDPAGRAKGLVKVEGKDIADLSIELSDTPDLGDFAPGGGGAPPSTPPPDNAAGAATVPGTQPNPGSAPPVATDAAAAPPPVTTPVPQ